MDSAHVAITVLKRIFYDMREPLFPFEIYDDLIQAARSSPEECLRVLELLPPTNRQVAQFLFDLFCCYLDHAENLLTPSSCGICIAPSIIRRWGRGCGLSDSRDITKDNPTIAASFLEKIISKLHAEGRYPKGLFDSTFPSSSASSSSYPVC